jgi:hypothetical protein
VCSTCIVWMSFIPIFIATNDNQIPTRVFALCAAPALNASVTLMCMFGPPVYVVLARPHKNTKATVSVHSFAVLFDDLKLWTQVLGRKHTDAAESSFSFGTTVRRADNATNQKQSNCTFNGDNHGVCMIVW